MPRRGRSFSERAEPQDVRLAVLDVGAPERARLADRKGEAGEAEIASTLAPANRWAVSIACWPVPQPATRMSVRDLPRGVKVAAGSRRRRY